MSWYTWLVETGEISSEQLKEAVSLAKLRSVPLPDAILSLHYADPWDITRAFSVQLGYPTINFYTKAITDEAILSIPDIICRDLEVFPVACIGRILWYATPHITDANRRNQLCKILKRDVRPMWAPIDWICAAERKYYVSCHMTESRSGWMFAKYGYGDWILHPGNEYREYVESRTK